MLVTHRLANVRFADRIPVLERSRLIEHGRHDELMARGGTYQELFSPQARAYAAETDAGTDSGTHANTGTATDVRTVAEWSAADTVGP